MLNKLQYKIHLILHSRIRLFLPLIICISYSFLHNDLFHTSLCEEVKNNNETNQTILGMSLFVGSIIFVFLLQQIGPSIDPTSLSDVINSTIDAAPQNINSLVSSDSIISDVSNPEITILPSCLDNFQISDVGDILINGNKIDLDNMYLNASVVEQEIVNNILHKQVADYQAFKLLDALAEANLINPIYFDLYDMFLKDGNRPEDFGAYLNKYLPQNP